MLKKNITSIILITISFAFIIVCLLYIVSKNRRVLKYKMKLGGLIIALTSISSGCVTFNSCYNATPYDKTIIHLNKKIDLHTSHNLSNSSNSPIFNLRYNVRPEYFYKRTSAYLGPDLRLEYNPRFDAIYLGPDLGISRYINYKYGYFAEFDYHYKILQFETNSSITSKSDYGLNIGITYKVSYQIGVGLFGRYEFSKIKSNNAYLIGIKIFIDD